MAKNKTEADRMAALEARLERMAGLVEKALSAPAAGNAGQAQAQADKDKREEALALPVVILKADSWRAAEDAITAQVRDGSAIRGQPAVAFYASSSKSQAGLYKVAVGIIGDAYKSRGGAQTLHHFPATGAGVKAAQRCAAAIGSNA